MKRRTPDPDRIRALHRARWELILKGDETSPERNAVERALTEAWGGREARLEAVAVSLLPYRLSIQRHRRALSPMRLVKS